MIDDMLIIRKMINAAKIYDTTLLNRNFLFIYETNPKRYEYFEASFEKRCFLHLTGIKPAARNMTSVAIYDKCIDCKISNEDIIIPKDGTVELKMKVLDCAMNIHRNARMVGEFDNSKIKLETEKIAGSTRGCLGFVIDENTGFYVPNTLLKEDLRRITRNPHRLLAVYSKSKKEVKYSTLRYCAKGIAFEKEKWN